MKEDNTEITEESIIEIGFKKDAWTLLEAHYHIGDIVGRHINITFEPNGIKVNVCEYLDISADNCNTIQDLKNLIHLFNIK